MIEIQVSKPVLKYLMDYDTTMEHGKMVRAANGGHVQINSELVEKVIQQYCGEDLTIMHVSDIKNILKMCSSHVIEHSKSVQRHDVFFNGRFIRDYRIPPTPQQRNALKRRFDTLTKFLINSERRAVIMVFERLPSSNLCSATLLCDGVIEDKCLIGMNGGIH
ncbi:hypothetical protein [Pseudoalteromonas umbrosa]|uniref:hypothetical protein n=1 Tax=Pseudoalteromonas umbrosa TaxID=3048489 RepID=UPI0024C3DA07|nr:hypothetical protein [Pseudoalteromonas sp. B95]MDK1290059.1 hypothetical protein [Pseudoalteromonas sp. B95]